jgi:hypothetical protein
MRAASKAASTRPADRDCAAVTTDATIARKASAVSTSRVGRVQFRSRTGTRSWSPAMATSIAALSTAAFVPNSCSSAGTETGPRRRSSAWSRPSSPGEEPRLWRHRGRASGCDAPAPRARGVHALRRPLRLDHTAHFAVAGPQPTRRAWMCADMRAGRAPDSPRGPGRADAGRDGDDGDEPVARRRRSAEGARS